VRGGRAEGARAEHVLALPVGREDDGHDVAEEGQQHEGHVDERHARGHQLDAALREERDIYIGGDIYIYSEIYISSYIYIYLREERDRDGDEGGDGQRGRQPQQQHAHEREVVERHQRVVLPHSKDGGWSCQAVAPWVVGTNTLHTFHSTHS